MVDVSSGFEDACLTIVIEDAAEEGKRRKVDERTVHVSRLMLMTNSEYFEAMMKPVWEGTNNVHITAESIVHADAMVFVLQLMYGGEPTTTEDLGLLAKAYFVADFWHVKPKVFDCLVDTLCTMPWSAASVSGAVLDMWGVLANRRGHERLMYKCVESLGSGLGQEELAACVLKMFGDVPATMASEAATKLFLALPFVAVHSWLQQHALKVHSENCVLALLTLYVEDKDDDTLDYGQLTQLAKGVRLAQLSPSFQHCEIGRSIPWFEKAVNRINSFEVEMALFRFRTYCSVEARAFPRSALFDYRALPRQLLPRTVDVSGEVSLANLKRRKWSEFEAIEVSDRVYVNGVFCRLMAKMQSNPSRPGEVCLGLKVTHHLFNIDDVFGPTVALLMHSHELLVEGPCVVHRKVVCKRIDYMFRSERYVLFRNISGLTVEDALQGLLSNDGKLKVSALNMTVE